MAFNSTLYCKRIDSNKRRCGSLCYVVSSLKENGRRKVNYGDVYIKLSKRYPMDLRQNVVYIEQIEGELINE